MVFQYSFLRCHVVSSAAFYLFGNSLKNLPSSRISPQKTNQQSAIFSICHLVRARVFKFPYRLLARASRPELQEALNVFYADFLPHVTNLTLYTYLWFVIVMYSQRGAMRSRHPCWYFKNLGCFFPISYFIFNLFWHSRRADDYKFHSQRNN